MIIHSKLYILFGGTTDYKKELLSFLISNIKGYTILEGKSSWNGHTLDAQVILFFNFQEAIDTKKFLLEGCNQKEVPLFEMNMKELEIDYAS